MAQHRWSPRHLRRRPPRGTARGYRAAAEHRGRATESPVDDRHERPSPEETGDDEAVAEHEQGADPGQNLREEILAGHRSSPGRARGARKWPNRGRDVKDHHGESGEPDDHESL